MNFCSGPWLRCLQEEMIYETNIEFRPLAKRRRAASEQHNETKAFNFFNIFLQKVKPPSSRRAIADLIVNDADIGIITTHVFGVAGQVSPNFSLVKNGLFRIFQSSEQRTQFVSVELDFLGAVTCSRRLVCRTRQRQSKKIVHVSEW